MNAFNVSPAPSAVGSLPSATVSWGAHSVRVTGDDASLQKFLAELHPPAAAPASPAPDGQRLGYRCVFGSANGYVPVNVQADPPGLTTTRQVAELEADISNRLGVACVLLTMQRIEISPVVKAEVVDVAAPDQPVPADDEQVTGA